MSSNDPNSDDSIPDLSSDEIESAEGPASAPAPVPDTGKDRRQIGPYKILQKIAEGGMGAVYMAEQTSPIKRRVALKVIKAGRDTEQIIARFEAERQALAMMDHANISRIFDAGTTDEGSPFFVMELVNGIPLTEYCDRNKLSIRERLELFVPVCNAVQHAHTKGIIHRDLKPSNVLVALYDGVPVPKVIDFGLAKATEHQLALTDKTMFTEFGQIVGTIQYMSPEQAEMNQLDVDTRTDVYSLGVMLYELLTGSTPLDNQTMKEQALLKVLELIRESEPPRPSTRLSQSRDAITGVSDQRKILPAKLKQILRGELDWIVMKSLEKDRRRRYETAIAFANDVSRFLEDEPVLARPQSTGYRVHKFIRKHKALVAFGLVVSALLFASAGISYWFMLEARAQRNVAVGNEKEANDHRAAAVRLQIEADKQAKIAIQKSIEADEKSKLAIAERNRADSEKEVAQEVRRFLQDSLISNVSVWERANDRGDQEGAIAGDNITVKELLDIAAQKYSPQSIDKAFPNRPKVQAEILQTICEAYRSIEEREMSVEFARGAAEVSRKHFGETSSEFVEGCGNLYFACVAAADFDGALQASQEGFEGVVKLYESAEQAETAEQREQRLALANEVIDELIDQWFEQMNPRRFVFPIIDSNKISSETITRIGLATNASHSLTKFVTRFNGADHERAKFTRLMQGFFDYAIGFGLNQKIMINNSIASLNESLAWAANWPEDRKLVRALVQTSVALMLETHQLDPERALELFEAGYTDQRELLRKDHPSANVFGVQVAMAYYRRDLDRKAFDLFTDVIPTYFVQLGVYPVVVDTYCSLATRLDEKEAAMETLRRAHLQCLKIYGHSMRAYSIERMQGVAATTFNDGLSAVKLFENAFERAKEKLGPEHSVTALASYDLASSYFRTRNFEAVIEQLQFHTDFKTSDLDDGFVARGVQSLRGRSEFYLGQFNIAAKHLRDSTEMMIKKHGATGRRALTEREFLVQCLIRAEEHEAAVAEAEKIVRQLGGGLFTAANPLRPTFQRLLAFAHTRGGNTKKAIEILLSLEKSERAKFEKSKAENKQEFANLLFDYGSVLRSDGQAESALKYLAESVALMVEHERPDSAALATARVYLGGAMLDVDSEEFDKIRSLLVPSHAILVAQKNDPLNVGWLKIAEESAAELIRLYTATGETEKRDQVQKQIMELAP